MIGLLISSTSIVSNATITKGFSGYLDVFAGLPEILVIIGLLFLLCALARRRHCRISLKSSIYYNSQNKRPPLHTLRHGPLHGTASSKSR